LQQKKLFQFIFQHGLSLKGWRTVGDDVWRHGSYTQLCNEYTRICKQPFVVITNDFGDVKINPMIWVGYKCLQTEEFCKVRCSSVRFIKTTLRLPDVGSTARVRKAANNDVTIEKSFPVFDWKSALKLLGFVKTPQQHFRYVTAFYEDDVFLPYVVRNGSQMR